MGQLHQAGMGRAVGIGQRVHAEATVMGPFPKIAAVSVIALAVFFLYQTVIRPFPHAAAHQAGIVIEFLPVVFHLAWALAHGMNIFAQIEGLIGIFLRPLLHLIGMLVHPGDHIRRFAFFIPLVMDGQAGVQRAYFPGHGRMVAAVARFIAQRPHNNASVIAIPLHHAQAAAYKLLFPDWILRDKIVGFEADHAVAFQIRFVDHIQAVFIAQRKQPGIIGIMAGADGVDVVPFHQQNVPQHFVHRGVIAQGGMGVMAVYALDFHGLPVHQEHALPDLHPLKAQQLALALTGNFAQQLVQAGRFRAPGMHLLYFSGNGGHAVLHRLLAGENLPAVFQQRKAHAIHALGLGGEGIFAVPQVFGKAGADGDVVNALFTEGKQHRVPKNAAEPPHILVLQVGAVRPLQHDDAQTVFPRRYDGRNIKFRGQMGTLGKADKLPVHIGVIAGAYALQTQHRAAARKGGGQGKGPVVYADGGIIGHKGRIIGNGESHVRILRSAVALQLPNAGHVDFPLHALSRFAGKLRHVMGRLIISEIPPPVQGIEIRRKRPLLRPGGSRVGIGNQGGTHGQPI